MRAMLKKSPNSGSRLSTFSSKLEIAKPASQPASFPFPFSSLRKHGGDLLVRQDDILDGVLPALEVVRFVVGVGGEEKLCRLGVRSDRETEGFFFCLSLLSWLEEGQVLILAERI